MTTAVSGHASALPTRTRILAVGGAVLAAVAVLVLSLAGPLIAATGAAATSTLVALHLAVGAVLIPALYRSAGNR